MAEEGDFGIFDETSDLPSGPSKRKREDEEAEGSDDVSEQVSLQPADQSTNQVIADNDGVDGDGVGKMEADNDDDDDDEDDDDYDDDDDSNEEVDGDGGPLKRPKLDASQRMSHEERKELKRLRRLEYNTEKKEKSSNGGKDKKSDSRKSSKKLIDDQAADSDDESNSDGDEDEHLDNYLYDGFVVEDADSSDDDVFKRSSKTKKVERTRLRKTGKAMLDEEDLALVQENRMDFDEDEGPDKETIEPDAEVAKDEDEETGGYIDPDATSNQNKNRHAYYDEEDEEMDDFIVDDAGDDVDTAEGGAKVKKSAKKKAFAEPMKRLFVGPTQDEIQESLDIFGIDNLDDLLDEEIVDEEDEENAEIRTAAKVQDGVRRLRGKFERQVLVDSFYTDRDEEIRNQDRPERLISADLDDREPTTEDEIKWIGMKLAELVLIDSSANRYGDHELRARELNNYVDAVFPYVEQVLRYLKEEYLEIQFIWAYRRDNLHPTMTRKHLWLILTSDEKWTTLQRLKKRLEENILAVEDAASYIDNNSADTVKGLTEQIEMCQSDLNDKKRIADLAEADRKKADDIIFEKEKFDSVGEDDREALLAATTTFEKCQAEVEEANGRLENLLTEAASARQKKIRHARYDPEGAKLVMTLFTKDKYIPIINNATDEQEVRDVFNFFLLLVRGAENEKMNELEKQMEVEGGSADQAPLKSLDVAAHRARMRKLAGDDKHGYFRYRRAPGVRDLVDQVANPAVEFGAYLTGDSKNEPCPTDPEALDYRAVALVGDDAGYLKSVPDVMKGIEVIIATEYAAEPHVVQVMRKAFRKAATISTRPTSKGRNQITPFSELFGIHFLDRMPVLDFLNPPNQTLFCRLLQAEHDGLLNITFNYPRVSEYDEMMRVFCYNTSLKYHLFPSTPMEEEIYPQSRAVLDEVRTNAMISMVGDHLLPKLELELRRELVRLGKEVILEEATSSFEKMLSLGPARFKPYDVNNREREREYMQNLLKACPERPEYANVGVFYFQDEQPFVMVYLDRSGLVRAHELIPHKALGKRTDLMKKFMKEHRPDVVLLNSSGGFASKSALVTLEKSLVEEVRTEIQNDAHKRRETRETEGNFGDYVDDDDETLEYRPNVMMLNDDVPKVFMYSSRAKKLLPEYHPTICAAVCLGRFAQEPLAEYCNMWTSASATGQFGFETLFLKIHPLQSYLKSSRTQLLRSLENALVNAVCDVGVDINLATMYDHHAPLLAFVAGLGLRKADQVRRAIRDKMGVCAGRQELFAKKIMGEKVWQNAVGFIRVTEEHAHSGRQVNPLDNTRIHPECYIQEDWAHKICADALEVEHNPLDYYEHVTDLMRQVKQDLSKRSKSPRWTDVWLDQGRPINGVTKYKEVVRMTKEGAAGQVVDKDLFAELPDCLALMELDAYVADLEATGHGKRKLQIDQIKEEIRFPWLDLRKPIVPPSDGEMFTILTGETDYTLYVGLKVGCTVENVISSGMDESVGRPKQKAIVKTDDGMRGTISVFDVVDNRADVDILDLNTMLPKGSHIQAVVIAVEKRFNSLILSVKPELMRHSEDYWIRERRSDRHAQRWFKDVAGRNVDRLFPNYFREDEALDDYVKMEEENSGRFKAPTQGSKRTKTTQRTIHHPLFVNCTYAQAEERLRSAGRGAGDVIFRPSSKPDTIAVSWLMHPDFPVVHFDFEERGRNPGSLNLGNELIYKQRVDKSRRFEDSYSDLDEVYSRFVEPMNDFVRLMVEDPLNDPFQGQLRSEEAIDEWLVAKMEDNMRKAAAEREKNPSSTAQSAPPYCLTFNTAHNGGFHMFKVKWIKGKVEQGRKYVRTHDVMVSPNGFHFAGEVLSTPSAVIRHFKYLAENGGKTLTSNRPSAAAVPARKSRFSAPVPQPPAAPMGSMYNSGPYGAPTQIPPMPMYGAPPIVSYGSQQYGQQQVPNNYGGGYGRGGY